MKTETVYETGTYNIFIETETLTDGSKVCDVWVRSKNDGDAVSFPTASRYAAGKLAKAIGQAINEYAV